MTASAASGAGVMTDLMYKAEPVLQHSNTVNQSSTVEHDEGRRPA